jgi:inositol phosphorylceramide mannosyltransferase catalytic subunit
MANVKAQIKIGKKKSPNEHCEVKEDMLPVISEGDAIPRLIHQTFSNRNDLPIKLRDNIEQIKAINPEWEHRLYDDKDIVTFIEDNYGESILSYYLRINPAYGAARADLFRYLCVYKCGGVYIDIKSTFNKPLNSVIRPDDRFLLSQWRNKSGEQFEGWGLHAPLTDIAGGEFQQWHIVAAKGHPFLRSVIKKVLRNIDEYDPFRHGVGFNTIWATTGPIVYTLAIVPILNSHPHRFLDITSEAGFQFSIYNKEKGESHYKIFKNHYTTIYEPVIKIGFFKEVIWHTSNFAKALQPLFKKK